MIHPQGIMRALHRIFNAYHLDEIPTMPKGVELFRRTSSRPGEFLDRGVVCIRSKGRTGARMRFALAQELRTKEILLPKPYRVKRPRR